MKTRRKPFIRSASGRSVIIGCSGYTSYGRRRIGIAPGGSDRSPAFFTEFRQAVMISLKRLSARKVEGEEERKASSSIHPPSAREAWGVLVEPMQVSGEAVYALTFHRKGTSIYYLHRHYRNQKDAEIEFSQIAHDLDLSQMEFELKYDLNLIG